MSLFAAIIFGEKVWIRGGIWIARGAGVGFVLLGILGILDLTEIQREVCKLSSTAMTWSLGTKT